MRTYSLSTLGLAILVAFAMALAPLGIHFVAAQSYNGGGLTSGVSAASGIAGLSSGDIRTTIISIINTVLGFMQLIAVVVIIVAGIRLVVSQGESDQIEKARKTIVWAVIGLVVILLSQVIVNTVYQTLGGSGGQPSGITGLLNGDIKTALVMIVTFVLGFMGLIAVIMVIVAGIRLVVSQGESDQIEKARKTIIYAVIGIVVILLSIVIVNIAYEITGGTPLGNVGITGLVSGGDVRQKAEKVLQFILSFMALLAVIFIIVAGIRLVVSQGESEQVDKAKKTIIYVVIGLVVILLAKVFVRLALGVVN